MKVYNFIIDFPSKRDNLRGAQEMSRFAVNS